MSEATQESKRRRTEEDFVNPPTPVDLCLKLLDDQRDCDLFFAVGPQRERIGAHKNILRARSTYFHASLSERCTSRSSSDPAENEIVLSDEDPSIFRSFLQHIYAYVFHATTSPVEAVQLLSLAQYYGVQSLVKCCEKLLAKPLQPDDFLQIFVASRKCGLLEVMTKAGETMANYFTQLANSSSFETADEATLTYLLERDDLNTDESDLFSALLRWADKQIENSVEDPKPGRNDILKNLLPLVRFPTMDPTKFADLVALPNILPVETERILFLYLMVSSVENRREFASMLPYSTIPRKNDLGCIKLYEGKPRPGAGAYLNVELKKASNVRDILSFSAVGWSVSHHIQVVSLVLERPRYGDEPLFQNSSEIAGINLPLKVAISCDETFIGGFAPIRTSEEVVVDIRKNQTIVTLDNPWVLSVCRTYKITTRFLSDVYTVPEVIEVIRQDESDHRDEKYDFFTATTLRDQVPVRSKGYLLADLSMSGNAETAVAGLIIAQAKSLTSGLHLIRSIQVTTVPPNPED